MQSIPRHAPSTPCLFPHTTQETPKVALPFNSTSDQYVLLESAITSIRDCIIETIKDKSVVESLHERYHPNLAEEINAMHTSFEEFAEYLSSLNVSNTTVEKFLECARANLAVTVEKSIESFDFDNNKFEKKAFQMCAAEIMYLQDNKLETFIYYLSTTVPFIITILTKQMMVQPRFSISPQFLMEAISPSH